MRSPACVSAMHMNGSHGEERDRERERGPAGIRSTWRSADSLVRYDPNDLPLYGLLLLFSPFL